MHNVVQPTTEEAINGLHLKNHWAEKQFKNNQGIVLELGCGKGEYTLEMARRSPRKNHIGIDIKGARLWRGAKSATEEGLENVAFLRTRIDFIENCFGENEVEEIWITFPDPQIKYNRAKHRLTHPAYLLIIQMLGLETEASYHDIYAQIQPNEGILFDVITHYERIWLKQGKAITYLRFKLDGIENALKHWKSRG